jgi:hypothetical protein
MSSKQLQEELASAKINGVEVPEREFVRSN